MPLRPGPALIEHRVGREPGPVVWSRRARSRDLESHEAAQQGWSLRYEQLSPGRFGGLIHHVQLPQVRLVLEHCGAAARQRGSLGPQAYGFALPLRDDAAPATFNGQRVGPGDVMLGHADALDLVTPPRWGLVAVVVDRSLLEPLWRAMYGRAPSAWIESQLVVRTRPGLAAPLRRLHRRMMRSAEALCAGAALQADDPAWLQLRDELLIEWFEALPPRIDTAALPGALARKRLVDAACTLLLQRPDEPLSLLEVCRRLGTSRRKLNYCFQAALGTSPVRYLRAVRLDGVRRLLRSEPTSVQAAAARWGFWHMGQFARDYRAQFGERPSETLHAVRR